MRNSCRIPSYVPVLAGFVLGIINALLWYFGFIPFVRPMIPYALAVVVVLFAITAVLKARCSSGEPMARSSTCASVRQYFPYIMIAGTVMVLFAIVVLATYLSLTVRLVLAFIGSISFFVMLFTFVAMIFSMTCRRD